MLSYGPLTTKTKQEPHTMKARNYFTYFLIFLCVISTGFSCKPKPVDTELELLKDTYQTTKNQKSPPAEVEVLKHTSVELAEAYLDRLDQVDDLQAAEYLYQAARLYEPSFVNPLRALELFEQFAATYPDHPRSPDVTFSIGYIYNNYLRDFRQARYAYERFLKFHPEHELTPSVKSEMEVLDLSKKEANPSENSSELDSPVINEARILGEEGE